MPRPSPFRRGFTLLELLVAISITVLLMVLLMSMVSTASDAWRLGRARLATNSQGAAAMQAFCRDLQSVILRSSPMKSVDADGEPPLWMEVVETGDQGDGGVTAPTVAVRFFSPVLDRETLFDPDPATKLAGDVCAVSYQVAYQDPLAAANGQMDMFGLYREVRDPRDTFDNFLGKSAAFDGFADTPEANNFLAGDVLDFAVSFVFEKPDGSRVLMAPNTEFRLTSAGVETGFDGLDGDEGLGARLVMAQVNVTILDEGGAEQIRVSGLRGNQNLAKFIDEHGYQFSQQVQVYSGL